MRVSSDGKEDRFTLNIVDLIWHSRENLLLLIVEYFWILRCLNKRMFHDEICLEHILHRFVVVFVEKKKKICLPNVDNIDEMN